MVPENEGLNVNDQSKKAQQNISDELLMREFNNKGNKGRKENKDNRGMVVQ
jgi:hypothetical protein